MMWFYYNHENTVNKYHFVRKYHYVRKIKNVKSCLVDRLR